MVSFVSNRAVTTVQYFEFYPEIFLRGKKVLLQTLNKQRFFSKRMLIHREKSFAAARTSGRASALKTHAKCLFSSAL